MLSAGDIQEKRYSCFLDFMRDQNKGSKILDIGSQRGVLCAHLEELGHDPYGVEVMEELVKSSRSEYPSLNFQFADCEKMIPFEDGFFDIVWAGDVIEHVRFTDVFINEINRVLKKDGLFVLTTPMHNCLKNIIIALCNFEKHFDPEFPHIRFYTHKSLKSVLEKRGFKLTTIIHIGRVTPIANTIFAVAQKEENKTVLSKYRF